MKSCFYALTLIILTQGVCLSQTDSLTEALNNALVLKGEFANVRIQKLNRLKTRLKGAGEDHEQRFLILSHIANEYKTFIYDSAFSAVLQLQRCAFHLQNPVKIAYARNQLGFILLSSGMFKETLDSLNSVNVNGLPDSIRADYYFILARVYYDLGDFDKDLHYTPQYISLGNRFIDSARNLYPSDSYRNIYLKGLKDIKNENWNEAHKALSFLLEKYPLGDHELAVTASTLSHFYISRNEPRKAIRLLMQAAIADIRSATKETSALSMLAELLYHEGEVLKAHTYIQHAMSDAMFYGARQRKAQVGSVLPVIASARLSNVEAQGKIWLVYSGVISALTMLLIVFSFIIVRQLRKRKRTEKDLLEANKIKEEYIGYYFNINSDYLAKIEAFKKSIEMKLLTRKVDDIKFVINGINLKREREELYHSFDKVFLKLFPDFVTVFNSYFRAEDRIVLKDGQLLNTELRIFALIRMGIHDNEKIARILDYSLSTIYNYKARIKSKSVVRNDEFEKKIMAIHAH